MNKVSKTLLNYIDDLSKWRAVILICGQLNIVSKSVLSKLICTFRAIEIQIFSMLCDSLDGGGVWRGMDTCICRAESLCCSPQNTTSLLIGYTPIQNKKFIKFGGKKRNKNIVEFFFLNLTDWFWTCYLSSQDIVGNLKPHQLYSRGKLIYIKL